MSTGSEVEDELVAIKVRGGFGHPFVIFYVYKSGGELAIAKQAVSCPDVEFVMLADAIANAGVPLGETGLPVIRELFDDNDEQEY